MKGKGRHPERALTPLKIKSLNKPGRYADGNGLYLVVDTSGAKRWLLRTMARGRRRDIGLGSLRLVSLAEAREKAIEYRRSARSGGDPVAERRKERSVVPTFAEAAKAVHAEHMKAWRNRKHVSQWISTLENYAVPIIGGRRIDQLETADVLRVLAPIWLTKPETARRVKQRLRTVFDWARAAGLRSGDNPVSMVALGLPKQADTPRHHAALPYVDVPEFLEHLRASGASEIARLAFEFLILTACRTGEVIGAKWVELDLERKVWTIPAKRMKSKREHRVPLCARSIDILNRAGQISCGSAYVFPGQSADKPLSNMAFLMALRRMRIGTTAHGFRSSFRDWASECSTFPREVCEMALGHVISDKVEAAYRRGDLFEKRRALMEAWAAYLGRADNVAPPRAS
jgi:integrase